MSAEPPTEALAEHTISTEDVTPEQLTDLITAANLQYSLKNYDAAAEIYSQATEAQASLHGEMASKNAELLYLYGRCLFKVALAKSDVLGGQVAGESAKSKKVKVEGSNGASKAESSSSTNGLFQVMESDDEDDSDAEAEGEGEEEEDDFATAYEILDLARLLFQRQMEELETSVGAEADDKGKGKATADIKAISLESRHVKERLADTHDLQAEISLENERFEDAVEDSRSTLHLLQQIESIESKFIAEAHYKLALALEFTFFKAVREAKEQSGANGTASTEEVKPTMLYEAVENLASAIISCETRIAQEEAKLPELSAEEASAKKKSIKEVREIVLEMMPRLADLKSTALSLSKTPLSETFQPQVMIILNRLSDAPLPSAALKELEDLVEPEPESALAQQPGESAKEREVRIKEAAAKATDLSGLVRKKKEKTVLDSVNGANGGSGSVKRKVEEEVQSGGEEKKVRFAGS